jgi:phosphatidylserine/phosphatidylglycerophosphate/cardiolipin synthase-like enzyme
MYVIRYDDSGPVAALLQALADAAKRGIPVRVIMDQGRDWKTGEPDDKHQLAAQWLRAHHVQVVLDELERTTHAKTIVIDGRTVIIGSHNWTRYALSKNREFLVRLDDKRLAEIIEAECATVPGWAKQETE